MAKGGREGGDTGRERNGGCVCQRLFSSSIAAAPPKSLYNPQRHPSRSRGTPNNQLVHLCAFVHNEKSATTASCSHGVISSKCTYSVPSSSSDWLSPRPATRNNAIGGKDPRRRNVTTSMAGLKNGHIRKNLIQNGEPQRYSWGTQQKKKNGEPQRYSCRTQKTKKKKNKKKKKKNGEPQR